MINEWYVNLALTDAKNKQYEYKFEHSDKRIKIGCKYSCNLQGEDYFIYNLYFKGRSIFSYACGKRKEVIADVMRNLNTPIEKLVNAKYL